MSRTGCVTYNQPAPLRASAPPRDPFAPLAPGGRGAARAWATSSLKPQASGLKRPRRAFTLVEMLVVVAIIGILASVLLGALFVATEHARAERTKSLISKLHNQMMQRWEEYETRRVPLIVPVGATNMDEIARTQLLVLNDILRMELPDQYEDLNIWAFTSQDPAFLEYGFQPAPLPALYIQPPNYVPSITRAYIQRVSSAADSLQAANPTLYPTLIDALDEMRTDNQSAEMLYLIMTTAAGDEDSGGIHFSVKDEGDTDGDGMPEFIDAWGNPIEWIRWPSGFANEDTTTTRTSPPGWGLVTDLISGDSSDDPDPFDPRRVRITGGFAPTSEPLAMATPPPVVFSFRLVPLIMSPGPDGEYGVAFRRSLPPAATDTERADLRAQGSEPYYFWENSGGGQVHRKGMPIETNLTTGDFDPVNGEWVHLDNITNHLTEAE